MSNNLMLNFQAKHLYVMLLIEFKTFDHCIAQRHKIFSFPRARLSFYCGNKSCNINHFSLFNFKKYLWSKYLLAFYQVLIRNIISLRAAHFFTLLQSYFINPEATVNLYSLLRVYNHQAIPWGILFHISLLCYAIFLITMDAKVFLTWL